MNETKLLLDPLLGVKWSLEYIRTKYLKSLKGRTVNPEFSVEKKISFKNKIKMTFLGQTKNICHQYT